MYICSKCKGWSKTSGLCEICDPQVAPAVSAIPVGDARRDQLAPPAKIPLLLGVGLMLMGVASWCVQSVTGSGVEERWERGTYGVIGLAGTVLAILGAMKLWRAHRRANGPPPEPLPIARTRRP